MYHHERRPPPPFLLSLFSLPHMFLLHVYIVLCYARPTTLTLLLLLLCACSSQAFHLSCSLSTCLLPFSSFSVTVSMLAAPIQCGPPPSCQSGRASLRLHPSTSWCLSASLPSRKQELCQCDGRACLTYRSCSSSCDVTS